MLIDGEMMYVNLVGAAERKSFLNDFSKKQLGSAQIKEMALEKFDSLAHYRRKEGNELFASGHFLDAIRSYNKAIASAEIDSEELGISYANRSACFLQMKDYASCLIDIELAKRNHYPARLLPKLDRRKIECENRLAANGGVGTLRDDPKLSFEADQKIPCFANGLEVSHSEKFGNYIKTKRDLEIGQTIIVERAFAYENPDSEFYCEKCYKRANNLIPCQKCRLVLFCSESCRQSAKESYHGAVCEIGVMCSGEGSYLIMKSIIIAIKTFATVEALMEAVEIFRAQNRSDVIFDDPAKQNYFQFFNMRTNVNKLSTHRKNEMRVRTMEIVEYLTSVSNIREKFQSKKVKQFLLHLTLHHMGIIDSNLCDASHGLWSRFDDTIGVVEHAKHTCNRFAIAPFSSEITHSCVPNVCRIFIDGTFVYKSFRRIKSGEQLFVSLL